MAGALYGEVEEGEESEEAEEAEENTLVYPTSGQADWQWRDGTILYSI